MKDGLLCRIFKKEIVTADDVVNAIIRAVMAIVLVGLGMIAFGNILLSGLDPTYMFQLSVIGIAKLMVISIIITVVAIISILCMFGLMVLLMRFSDKISDYLKTITIAQCPIYKNKKP